MPPHAPNPKPAVPVRIDAPARVLAYARVSSDAQEREGTSLEAQQEILTAYCKAKGWPAPQLYVEVESGGELARERRVELARLERTAAESDVILVCHVDRWSRDIVYTVDSVRKLTRRGVRWEATEDGIDATTDRGMSWLIDRAADAEKERARIRARTVGTRQRLRAQGYHVEGHAPLGFRIEKRKLVPSEHASIVRRMFDLCVAGRSGREIGAALQVEYPGTPGLDNAAIMRRLRDRRYLGESNTKGSKRKPLGNWIRTHDPLIDPQTWARAQTAIESRREGGRKPGVEARTAGHLLRGGLLLCAHCGRTMGCHVPTPGESVKHGGYYLCRKRTGGGRHACDRGPLAPFRQVDDQVVEAVEARLVALADRLSKPAAKRASAKQPPHEQERARHVARLDRLVAAVADGVLAGATAKAKIDETEAAIRRIDDTRAAPQPPPIDRAALLAQVDQLRRAWRRLGVPDQQAAVRLLAEKIEIESTAERRWQRAAWRLRITWRKLAN